MHRIRSRSRVILMIVGAVLIAIATLVISGCPWRWPHPGEPIAASVATHPRTPLSEIA